MSKQNPEPGKRYDPDTHQWIEASQEAQEGAEAQAPTQPQQPDPEE